MGRHAAKPVRQLKSRRVLKYAYRYEFDSQKEDVMSSMKSYSYSYVPKGEIIESRIDDVMARMNHHKAYVPVEYRFGDKWLVVLKFNQFIVLLEGSDGGRVVKIYFDRKISRWVRYNILKRCLAGESALDKYIGDCLVLEQMKLISSMWADWRHFQDKTGKNVRFSAHINRNPSFDLFNRLKGMNKMHVSRMGGGSK